ncbi:MAG: acireductone synthase [Polyangiaceae bacterium]
MPPALLTDIEGTTSSLSFVKDVLFPYARLHIPDYVKAHRGDPGLLSIFDELRASEQDPSLDEAAIVALLCRFIDEDRKVTPLKTLQGYVWAEGYRTGAFHGHVYEDAVRRLRAWHAGGVRLYVFSSGSVSAQKALFAHTAHGDLSALFSGFFDTTTGAKRDAASYARIAAAIRLPPHDVAFLSDTVQELDAAREAGMVAIWLDRSGEPNASCGHPKARDFDEVDWILDHSVLGGGEPSALEFDRPTRESAP